MEGPQYAIILILLITNRLPPKRLRLWVVFERSQCEMTSDIVVNGTTAFNETTVAIEN